ncbi:hypothetical protein AA0472_0942 [Acetobacter estunensis NRIC 0472]|uniref:DUF4175 family protein n=1 Tax=Acetobacter estunensis TaxID=104097 RepID=A0A967EAT3_9PROT|nr:DUF4175 family protein [Acetobacter estunensis]NHO52703.1 DUF4175 family protein [Acetobacter estunensis]GBQ22959.1 hypothetical protein AA0472_0942 [Acetobacter estunensis NRIC 0472]
MSEAGPQHLTNATTLALPREAGLAAVRQRARRLVAGERLIVRLSPAVSVVGLYGLSGLLRVPQSLPDWLHACVEIGTAGVVVWLVRRGLRGFVPPSRAVTDRRIEMASGLKNRPLEALADLPAHIGAEGLWGVHQQRILAALGPLRTGGVRLASLKGASCAAIVLLACAGAGVIAGSHAPGRLVAALVPGIDDPDVPLPRVEAWITPPSYASSAPVFLGKDGASSGVVPEGSVLVATISGLPAAPRVRGDFRNLVTQPLGDQSWRVQAVLSGSGSLALTSRGRTIASWQLNVAPDRMPQVAWGEHPGGEKGGRRTRLPYRAAHAYGLDTLTVEMRLAHPGLLGSSRVFKVPVPLSGHPLEAKGAITPDLSDDPWAGEEVVGVLVAKSVSGKEARSNAATFRLGSRKFRSPVARAVLDLRRRLALGGEGRSEAAQDLAALGDTPGPIAENTGTFLNLAAIVALLNNADVDDPAARDEAVGRLWDLALDIEDQLHGGREAALASIDVRAAQEAVSQQLQHMRQDNAHGQQDQAELKKRMDDLRSAISRKMQTLAEQAIRNGTAIPDLPGLTKSGDQAFRKLMERLQNDAAEGHGGDAMEKLQQLEDSVEKMRNATPQDMAKLAQQMVAQQKLREQAAGLDDLVRQQSGLLDHAQSRLDKARRQAGEGQPPQGGGEEDMGSMSTTELLQKLGLVPPDSGSSPAPAQQAPTPPTSPSSEQEKAASAEQTHNDAAAQHALTRATQELGSEFKQLSGKDVPAFSTAEKAMKDARHALAQGDDQAASQAQSAALKALQQGRGQMKQALQSNGGGGSGSTTFLPSFGGQGQEGEGQQGGGDEDNASGHDGGSDRDRETDRDPLGRATGEGKDSAVDQGGKLPDTLSRERAHEIEEELRRRDSDRTRPKEELDYLDRLLKSF